jgi:uncharacterized repeat protein (TIGR02543 family)
VYIGAVDKSKFEKTGGTITSSLSDMENGNSSSMGKAVYAGHSRFIRYKESTSGPENKLTYIRDEPKPPTISGGWDYTVNFVVNGGSQYLGQQFIAFGSKVIEPPTMSKTGYTFGGWYRETDFINLWNFDADTVIENITLYAKWIIIPIPDAPGTPVITPSNGSLTVQWTAVEYAANYEVWIGTTNNSANAQQTFVFYETSYTFIGLANGTTYYVWLKARNTTGASGFSPMASGEPMGDIEAVTLVSSNGQLAVSWSAVAGAAQYEVYYHTSYSIPATPAQTVSTTTATISGLTNGTTYYVWVKPKNVHGTGNASAAASGKPIGNMGAVTLTPGESGQLVLSWAAVAGADQYEVYHSTSESIPASPTQTVTTTTATVSSLSNGTTYYVWVKPKNANGTGGTSAVKNGVPIATPGNLTLSAANQQITVSWAAVPGASGYQVYYRNTTTIPASPFHTGAELNCTVTNLTNGTTYYFWVKAVNDNGAGAASPMASGKPIGNMGTVTLTPGESGQLVLSWVAVAGADQYEVYHSAINTIPASPGQTVSTTTATISGLTNGTTHYAWVKPKNAHGVGGTSAAASGVPIEAPGNLTLSGANQQITVSWTAVPGANSYEVYYSATTTIPASSSYTVTGLSRTITSLTNGTTYHFWVKAVNANGTSVASPMASGKPVGNMGTVTLASGNGQFALSWSAVTGADQYEVYHSTIDTIPATPDQTVSTTTATIIGLTNGTTYYVWVKPKNANGTGNTNPAVSGKPLGTPGIPTVKRGFKHLQITWTAVPGADEYEVYYGTDTTPTTLATTTIGNIATITGLTNSIVYYVRLKAKNANGISDYGPNGSYSAIVLTSGLYRGVERIGSQNLSASLSYISSNAVSGDDFYIILGADESTPPMTLNYSGKTVGITLAGYGAERTITLTSNGFMFLINSGVTLTLDENITLMGLGTNTAPLVYLNFNNSGNLVINAGAKISGNTSSSSNGGGGIGVLGGTLTMNGGTISGNTASSSGGGGIYVGVGSGTVTINGGTINGNTASSGGGGIVVSIGTVTMNGGTISGNEDKGGYGGGGIGVLGGTLTMNGGIISGNTATRYGGGVYVYSNGSFNMHGGTISGNTSGESGGGVESSNGTFKKQPSGSGQNSGIIYGNEETGFDTGGVSLKNTAGNNTGHAVFGSSNRSRNTTAGQTDQIDSTTGRGLSTSGNPPYGQ